MDRRFIFIINPISGTADKQHLNEKISLQMAARGFEYHIYPSVASGDYSFLEPVIEEMQITDVVIAGGDGTINQVVAHLRKFNLSFGIIPCGSGNGLAFSAGIPRNEEKALNIVFNGKSRPVDAFLVNRHFACMLCGLGLDAQVAHDFAQSPKRGLITYVKKTIADFIKAPAYPFLLTTRGRTLHVEAFFISLANSNQFGNHFTIAPKASLSDGLLDVVIMTRQNKMAALFNTLRQISGYNKIQAVEMVHENSSLIYFQTDDIQIKNMGLAPLHIDGDPVETLPELDVKVLKDCFRLIH